MAATADPILAVGNKRRYDDVVDRNVQSTLDDSMRGRALGLDMDKIVHGADFSATLKNIVNRENPETLGKALNHEGEEIYWHTLLDWLVANPRILNEAISDAFQGTSDDIFRYVFPIEYTDAQKFKGETIIFGRNFAPITTRKTAPRYLSSYVRTFEGNMQFTAQMVVADMYALRQTPDGPRNFADAIDALYSNLNAFLILTAYQEPGSVPSFHVEKPEQQFPGVALPTTVEEVRRIWATRWGIITKEPQGLQKVFNHGSAIFRGSPGGGAGERVKYAIWTASDANYVLTKDQTNTWREFSGDQAIANRNRVTPDALSSYGDVKLINIPFLSGKLHDEYAENVYRTRVAFGSFWRFLPTFVDVPAADYRTYMSNTQTCSWTSNGWDTYSVEDAVRHDVHFIPFNVDLRYPNIEAANEGKLDRDWLIKIGEKVAKGGKGGTYEHRLSRTNFDKCRERVDIFLCENKGAGELGRQNEVPFYVAQAMGQLDERHTPTKYFHYMYDAMFARIFEVAPPAGCAPGAGHVKKPGAPVGITVKEQQAFEAGLALMQELGQTFVAQAKLGGAVAIGEEGKEADYYAPNQWGGPALDTVDVNNLSGLGTMAGFLTVANMTTREQGTANRRVAIIKDFVAVYEKMVKRAMAIQAKDFAPFSSALLPRYHKHKDLSPLHAAMIVSSYILLPFQYPVAESTGTAVTVAPVKPPEMQRRERLLNALEYWNNAPSIKGAVANVKILQKVIAEETRLREALEALKKTSKSPEDAAGRTNAVSTVNLILSTDPTLNRDAVNALLKELFGNIISSSSSSSAPPVSNFENLKTINANLSPDSSDNTAILSALASRTFTQLTADEASLTTITPTGKRYIRQLHYAPSTTLTSGIQRPFFEKDGSIVYSTFDYDHAHTTAGTLFGAAPFILAGLPETPASGHDYPAVRYTTGAATRKYVNGVETRPPTKYEERVFRRDAFESFKTQLKNSGVNAPDLFVQALAFPLSGSPASQGELTDIDRRVKETYELLSPARGWAARLVLFSDITLQTDAAFAAANVPRPWFPLIIRKDETQHMRSIPLFNGLKCGKTYIEKAGMDRIASFTADNKEFRVEVGFGHKVMIEDNRSFYIAEYVKGDAILGGCGNRFVNDGWWRGDEGAWSRNVAGNIGDGERLGKFSNICALGTVMDAECATGLYTLDVRGYHSFGDYCMVLPQNSTSFAKRTSPMYPGQVVVTEAFPFMPDTPVLTPPEFSFANAGMLKRVNHSCDQVTQLVYCHTSPDKQRVIQSHHLWGDRLPGLTEKEQSNAPIKISDHFNGSTLRYLPQVMN
jgi:hypothetical protein